MGKFQGTIDIKNGKKGFITVEAAIFLPIFLIGMLTLLYLIKVLWIEEAAFFLLEKEAKNLSKTAYYVSEEVHKAQGKAFEITTKGKLFHEAPFDVKNVSFQGSKYFYEDGLDGMIFVDICYEVPIRLPIQIQDTLKIEETVLFRGFIGTNQQLPVMGFQEMETEKACNSVWVFPRSGEKFHVESCAYISNKPRQMYMSQSIKRKYDSCKLCKSDDLVEGNILYCFVKTGQVYHKGICKSVDKYVIDMDREEAVTRGYTPCLKCGGG